MLSIVLALAAATAAPVHPGIWGDVVASRQSGDYGGIELRIPAADSRTIDLVICEGGCSPVFHPAIEWTSDGFRFAVAEPMENAAGHPASLPPRHCEARFEGDRLVVRWIGEGTVDHLRRLHHAHALAPGAPHEIPVLE